MVEAYRLGWSTTRFLAALTAGACRLQPVVAELLVNSARNTYGWFYGVLSTPEQRVNQSMAVLDLWRMLRSSSDKYVQLSKFNPETPLFFKKKNIPLPPESLATVVTLVDFNPIAPQIASVASSAASTSTVGIITRGGRVRAALQRHPLCVSLLPHQVPLKACVGVTLEPFLQRTDLVASRFITRRAQSAVCSNEAGCITRSSGRLQTT